jgi:hypothetical protein
VASLLPGRRSEINIYGSADIDSRFLPDQLTLTHGFFPAGVGKRSAWWQACCRGGPTSSRCGPTTGPASDPGPHPWRSSQVPSRFLHTGPGPTFKNSPDTRPFPIHKLSFNKNNKLIFLPPNHLPMKTLWRKNQENSSDRISHAWAPLRAQLPNVYVLSGSDLSKGLGHQMD